MIFSENPNDRMYERLMKEKPSCRRDGENEEAQSELIPAATETNTAAEMLRSDDKSIS